MSKNRGFGKKMKFRESDRMVYIACDQKEEPQFEVVVVNGDIIGIEIPKDNSIVESANIFAIRGEEDYEKIEPLHKVKVNLFGYILVRNEDIEKIGDCLEIESLIFTDKFKTVTEFLMSSFNIDEM